ncbi:MAG: RluA family pseudouridine synthase [Oscillospiraceae bacterium]|nr:RluA family pseudouridine synthase [Oscillospiraceae bacterium]MBR6696179.1 RluA family pseudouridine synthase [Oscillospiraceae bacterium]
MNEFVIPIENKGERLDKFISSNEEFDLTRTAVQNLITEGMITVNGKKIAKNYVISGGETVSVEIPEPVVLDVLPENIPIDIVYEDDYLLVVNKPKGMVVHPAAGNYTGTLVNALMYHCKDRLSSINGVIRPGIVHRIDKNTSGLLIVAKTDSAHLGLAEQIKEHSFTREYETIIVGRMKEYKGTIDAPIGRHHIDRKKMCVTDKNSKNAVTHYEVLEEFREHSYLKLRLETGRTHQIRVHLSYVGHAVLGDDVYGKPVKDFEGQCLHARKIGFVHPITNEYLEFSSDLPDYFEEQLRKLRMRG